MRKNLYGFLLALLMTVIAACNGGGSNSSSDSGGGEGDTASTKAITAFSLNGTAGTIDEDTKTISVTLPYGTSVNSLIATFTTTGASVRVDSVDQISGTTANNFSAPVIYTVTAADSSSVAYTATVTVMECANGFVYDDAFYQTSHGYIESVANDSDRSDHYVYLCSPELTLANGGVLSGTGDQLMISFVSNSADELLPGIYALGDSTLYAYFWLGYDPLSGFDSQFGLSASETSSATVSVNGNTYEIEYSFIVQSGKTVNGYYKGSLEAITGLHS